MYPLLKPVKKCYIYNISIAVVADPVKLWQPVQIFNLNKVKTVHISTGKTTVKMTTFKKTNKTNQNSVKFNYNEQSGTI